MPLINSIGPDPALDHIRLKHQFNGLPMSDQASVIKFIEMGRRGEVTEDLDFSVEGREFISKPEFKTLYEQKVQPEPPPELGMIRGLMEIIKQQAHIREPVPEGHLKPEHAERVGGKQNSAGTAVNQNFDDVINGITDGTKDLTVSAFTGNGAATFNGAVTLGNATGDDITITGRVAADVDPKTASTHDLGDATQLWNGVYCMDVFASAGAVGTPSHSFSGDTDTGMYASAANTLDFATGGTNAISISSAQLTTLAAATVTGALTANGAVTLGNATGDDITVTGRIAADIDPKTASATDLGDATQLWQHVYADNIRASINAVGDPSYSFHADTDTGMYSSGANVLDFATGGTIAAKMTASQKFETNVRTDADGGIGNIFSGTYTATAPFTSACTPAFTNSAFTRVGDVVTVCIKGTLTTTSAGGTAEHTISLPSNAEPGSNFGGTEACGGSFTVNDNGYGGMVVYITASGSSKTVGIKYFNMPSGTTIGCTWIFTVHIG
jgi:hypothetical protein